jgi:hypothetical protein
MAEYILAKFIIDRCQEEEFVIINKAKFMKDNLLGIKGKERDVKYIKMVIYILDNLPIIKSMEMEVFFGLMQIINRSQNLLNITKGNGGVVYLMGKVNIKNQWVYCILYR